MERPHVLVIGGGFGGLMAARGLAGAPVRVTLVDRCNYHLFQPLLYQVAMAGLSPADIAVPIRSVLRRQRNASVLLAEVIAIDVDARRVTVQARDSLPQELEYDTLVLATGARTSYFGHDRWSAQAPGLKDIDDALEVRRRVLLAFERAEQEHDAERRRQLMTFVVIGGGPTGVELAGALVELARFVLARDFRRIDPAQARVVLLEGGPRVLPSFPEALSRRALEQLEGMGVQVCCQTMVTEITPEGVRAGSDFVGARTVLWAAGVRASPLAEALGVQLDGGGRVPVESDCSVPGHPEVFVIGDLARFEEPGRAEPLPGVAPVAMQQGRFVAEAIRRTLAGGERGEFRYKDRGNMATIGRKRAIADLHRFRLSGFPAWLAWLLVHILFLIGFRNRLLVLFNWTWSFFTYQRGARLITRNRESAP